jgi:hypothetical protein
MTEKHLKYQFMERRVRGQAYVDIHVLQLPVPRYSFKVGSARITYAESGEKQIDTIPYLNSFSYRDAADLLREVGDEFERLRDSVKAETASQISDRLTTQVEVLRRRPA